MSHAKSKFVPLTPKDIPESMQGGQLNGVLAAYITMLQEIGKEYLAEQAVFMSRMVNLHLDEGAKYRIAETLVGIHFSMQPNSKK